MKRSYTGGPWQDLERYRVTLGNLAAANHFALLRLAKWLGIETDARTHAEIAHACDEEIERLQVADERESWP